MISTGELVAGLCELKVGRDHPVIVHASLSSFGKVEGGALTVVQVLLSLWDTLIIPTFTYKTMLTPEVGPPGNGISYGSRSDANLMAEFFSNEMPADRSMGAIPEVLRRTPGAYRSSHPILSFAGVNAQTILESQSLREPLALIHLLREAGGWVVLLGVDHTVNTSIHFAERLTGRKQFIRWALTPTGVEECPGFPGCSDGFEALAPDLVSLTRRVHIGQARVQAVPLDDLIKVTLARFEADPLALLCEHSYCERCQAIRSQAALVRG